MKWLSILCLFVLILNGNPIAQVISEPAKPEDGIVIAFFPADGESKMIGPSGIFELVNGKTVHCPAGEYLVTYRNPNYSNYQKKIEVVVGAETILIPELMASDVYRENQIQSLVVQGDKVGKTKKKFTTSSIAGWALGFTCLAAAGGIEFLLGKDKADMQSAYDRYRGAPAQDAPVIWREVEALKGQIDSRRLYELIAIGAACFFTGSGLLVNAAAPTSAQIDRQIELLREAVLK